MDYRRFFRRRITGKAGGKRHGEAQTDQVAGWLHTSKASAGGIIIVAS
jgi:hypothetical protein